MRFGRVIGKVTLADYEPSFKGGRWLVVSPMDKSQLSMDAPVLPLSKTPSIVIYDDLGAGQDDIIGFSEGGEAAAVFNQPTPVDAYNVAIIDEIFHDPNS